MLIDKLDIVEKRYKEIYQLIGDPEIISNQKKYIELNKELKDLKKLVDKGNDYKTAIASKKEAESYISDSSDKDMTDMAKEQLEESKQNITKLEEEIKILLIPKDPDDSKNVVMEIRAGTGGDEAGGARLYYLADVEVAVITFFDDLVRHLPVGHEGAYCRCRRAVFGQTVSLGQDHDPVGELLVVVDQSPGRRSSDQVEGCLGEERQRSIDAGVLPGRALGYVAQV